MARLESILGWAFWRVKRGGMLSIPLLQVCPFHCLEHLAMVGVFQVQQFMHDGFASPSSHLLSVLRPKNWTQK
jgi:hypothetical protein